MTATTTTIDIETDELLPVAAVIKERLGKKLSAPTLWRWRVIGIRGVKLECVLAGGVWCTTLKAFAEFLRAQTAAALERGAARSRPKGKPARPSPTRDTATRNRLANAGLL